MSLLFYSFFGLIGLILVLFFWSIRKPQRIARSSATHGADDESDRRHISYLPQIRQTFSDADFDFLSKNASREVLRRVRRERRDVALAYLAALGEDFHSLLRMARAIAMLSPELDTVHEFERISLAAKFAWQYQIIRWELLVGIAPLAQLGGLSDLVSGLSVRIEAALTELGERAAVAAELASSMNRRGLGAG
ncbi:MAG TPA: hypothetical protein VJO16_01605 [Candidatus Acidoferrum sp.]|nr:hypothetical protein [Candidatus Acidoferrum sp.]